MEKLNKYICFDIFSRVGNTVEVMQLSQVCKRWSQMIKEMPHIFTFQGVRHPKFIPANLNISPILQKFTSGLNLHSLDLRNIQVESNLLSEVLLTQKSLIKLDLTNTQLQVGQVWSYMQTKKGLDAFYLEELRITNNMTVYLGFDALVNVYPNLIKLYAGNTKTNLDNLTLILERLPKLQLLDVSLCNIDVYDMAYVDFRKILENSDLQKFFISEINETVVDNFISFNIEIIENTIGDLLKDLDEHRLEAISDWLQSGGDVNLMCSSNHKLYNELGAYPQCDIISKNIDESVLRECFRMMISHNLDLGLHMTNFDDKRNLLNTAIINKQTGLVHLLIASGCDISPSITSDEEPPMTLAARIGEISIIQIFLDFHLLSTDYYSPKFCNPVCASASLGKTEMFLFLIEQGVPLFPCPVHPNILISNKEILNLALSEEHKSIFSFPQEMLYEAAQYYIHKSQAEQALLIIKNLEGEVKDKENEILSNKVQSSARISPELHKTLMILATEKKLVDVLKVLIELGYDINGEDNFGWTPLIAACSYGYLEFLPYLCDNGAIVNKRDKWWRTALHQAAQNGHSNVVRELIRYGAAINPECDQGLTPYNYALVNLRLDCARILREHGGKSTLKKKMCSVF